MSTIVTRSGKGSPLTHVEVDANFTNLNTDKYQEGSAIGATTPAAGTFTTLTATGQTSLGGDASNPTFRANALSGVTRWIETNGSVAGTPQFASSSTGAAAGMNFLTRGATGFNFSTNTSIGTVQLAVSHTASAVNYVQVTGAATTVRPKISTAGSDATIGLTFDSKGSGSFAFTTNANANPNFSIFPQDSPINYLQVRGASTGIAAQMSSLGSDTNVAMALVSKGTGAIDLAAGSSGVNISNGGTVTAITRTATGSLYTGFPSLAITAPTTAGGVQATATPQLVAANTTVIGGGTGYTVNDVLTVTTGGGSGTINITVTAVSGGVITAATASSAALTSIPSGTVSVSGGTGTGATFTLIYVIAATFSITNAGSGYVEQPTVTFSGGGGSGAAAYATVGSDTTIKSIGTNLFLSHPNGVGLQVKDNGQTACYPLFQSSGTTIQAYASSSGSNVGYQWVTKGTSAHAFATNASVSNTQMQVTHTASAVNYVQVTGAATGSRPVISAQGSDSAVNLQFDSKGTGSHVFRTNNVFQFAVLNTTGAVNYGTVTGSLTGVAPSFSVAGSDTNIDLALTPKGTGLVRFGTYTANMALTIQGYIEIKDSGGTTRRLAVIA